MTSILIADDSDDARKELRENLKSLGYRIASSCKDAVVALEKTAGLMPQLALLSASMPGVLDGLRICREIRDRLGVPVVLTARGLDEKALMRALEEEPHGLILDPGHRLQVKAAVETALMQKAGEQQFARLLGSGGETGEKRLLYAVLESSPFGLAVISPKGRLAYTNKEIRNITGYGTAHTKSAYKFLTLILPDADRRDAFIRSWTTSRDRNTASRQEETIQCADGTRKVVEARTVFLDDGTAVMTAIDVTEHCKALDALKESEYKFRTVADYTYDWEFWLNPDWRLEYVSPSCEGITGHPAQAFMERPGLLFDIVLDEDSEALRTTLDQTMYQGMSRRQDFRVRTKDGEIRWLSMVTTPLPGQNGAVAGIRGSIRNITWRKRAEEALRRAEEKYRTIFEEAPLGVFRSTPEGRFSEVNPALAAMLGYDSPQQVLDNVQDIARDLYVRPERRPDIVGNTLAAQGSVTFENEYYKADGTTFTANVNIRVVRDEQGEILYLEGMVEDITQKKQAEALREDVERMTRHDLKSPLISILYGMRLLSAGENLTTEQREIVEHSENSGYRMLNMLNLSLDLYKMETGSYQLQPKPLDLAPVVRRIFDELAGQMKPKGVSPALTIHGEPDKPDASFTAIGEELLLYSMLSNLVRNAVEASPENSRVEVNLSDHKDRDHVAISIHNKGAVPEDIRDTFFEKYVTSGKREGTGLGAYGAKLIAVTHGGGVACDSDEERGTTVTVILPKKAEK